MGPNNNIDLGGPGSLNLIFQTSLNGPPTIVFKWSSNNSFDPRGPAPFNLIFANQLKNTPYNNIIMALI